MYLNGKQQQQPAAIKAEILFESLFEILSCQM
jgi:hypothetical protein